ncbi:MAG: hypothetical protein PHD48_02745 [Alphaproteobacteria bacterium]|nr:hypothetical protein [Alphaproteobacteria bacterium]
MKYLQLSSSVIALSFGLLLAPSTASLAATTVSGAAGDAGISTATNGGDGQDANITELPLSGSPYTAIGGAGGDAYTDEETLFGSGGNGGAASAQDHFTHEGSETVLSVTTIGGNGGQAFGINEIGGAGGVATTFFDVTQTNLLPLSLSGYQIGGDGGDGFLGAAGGNGASSMMLNAVMGTATADEDLYQEATGGHGGSSAGGLAGSGGDARSILTLDNKTASSLIVSSIANAGSGGDAMDAAAVAGSAGDAVSSISITDTVASSVRALVRAVGGDGGDDEFLGEDEFFVGATKGGDAHAELMIQTFGTSAGRTSLYEPYPFNVVSAFGGGAGTSSDGFGAAMDGGAATALYTGSAYGLSAARVTAEGGAGGDHLGFGDGGTGGFAEAHGDLTLYDPTPQDSFFVQNELIVQAFGGSGGDAYAEGAKAGNGGESLATAVISAVGSVTDHHISASVYQAGGSGGNGYYGADGGDGADSVLDNAVSGTTSGVLTLVQTAQGGAAGASEGGTAGVAGNALVTLSVADMYASELNVYGEAIGGLGGDADLGVATVGGQALSDVSVISTRLGATVRVSSNAPAGYGGMSYSSDSDDDESYFFERSGTSHASASATGAGFQNVIEAYAVASGDTGQSEASSTVTDLNANKLITKASGGLADSTLSASTLAVAGLSSYQSAALSNMGHVSSIGNLTVSAQTPSKLSQLGTASADFTVVGDGGMGAANNEESAQFEPVTYSMSADYSFADLGMGNDLLFGLTDSTLYGTGFQSLSFSLTQDNSLLYSNTFASMDDWNAFFESPLSLGSVDGATRVQVAMSEVLLGIDNGYLVDFAFVTAPSGTITGAVTSVSNVPLPAAAPLFVIALGGLGFWGRCRNKREMPYTNPSMN